MTEARHPKDSDQEETERAFQIIQSAIEAHPDIEPSIWFGALFSKMVQGCIASGLEYSEFCQMIDGGKDCYKDWFGDEKTN